MVVVCSGVIMSTFAQALQIIKGSFKATWDTVPLTGNRNFTYPNKSGTVALTSDITGGGGSSTKSVVTVFSSRSILNSDLNNIIRCNSSSTINLNIPSNSFAIGSVVDIVQRGTGSVRITRSSGIVLLQFGGEGTANLIGQYARCQLIKIADGEWHAAGDISI